MSGEARTDVLTILARAWLDRLFAGALVALGAISPLLVFAANHLLSAAAPAYARLGAELALPLRLLQVPHDFVKTAWAILATLLVAGLFVEWRRLGRGRGPFAAYSVCFALLVTLVSLVHAVFVTSFLLADVLAVPDLVTSSIPSRP